MITLCSLAPASAGLRYGVVGCGIGKPGLVQGARWMSGGRPQQRPMLSSLVPSVLGRGRIQLGLTGAGSVTVQARARWFVVSARSRRDAKEDESGQKPGPSSALSKLLPNMAKTTRRENIYTIPNLLTASRLVAAPFIGYCILHDYHAWTLGLFAYAGITDALDGWIARRWNLGTVVGTIIDPMADKTLMTVLTVGLAMKGALPGMATPLPVRCFLRD